MFQYVGISIQHRAEHCGTGSEVDITGVSVDDHPYVRHLLVSNRTLVYFSQIYNIMFTIFPLIMFVLFHINIHLGSSSIIIIHLFAINKQTEFNTE